MKKQIPTSKRARSATGWHKHLRRVGKRRANRGTRRILRVSVVQEYRSDSEGGGDAS